MKNRFSRWPPWRPSWISNRNDFSNSQISMARTPLARLPWLIRTQFWVPIAKENKYWRKFSFYYEIVCCVYSLESPHWGNSNEYTQHTIILLKIENISINYSHLLPDLAPWLNLTGLNYLSLEQISVVPKMFEPLKFDCIWATSLPDASFKVSSQLAQGCGRSRLLKQLLTPHDGGLKMGIDWP